MARAAANGPSGRAGPLATLRSMLPTAVSNGEVILIVTFVVLPIAAIAFAGAGAVYREIGKGAFAMDHDKPARAAAVERSAPTRAGLSWSIANAPLPISR